jgi:hypothetical protein
MWRNLPENCIFRLNPALNQPFSINLPTLLFTLLIMPIRYKRYRIGPNAMISVKRYRLACLPWEDHSLCLSLVLNNIKPIRLHIFIHNDDNFYALRNKQITRLLNKKLNHLGGPQKKYIKYQPEADKFVQDFHIYSVLNKYCNIRNYNILLSLKLSNGPNLQIL